MSPHGRAGDGRRPAWPPEPRSACRLLLGVTLLVAGLAVSLAQAAQPPGHSLHHGSAAVRICLPLLALAGLCLAAAHRRGRHAAILSLGLLVGLFGLETAVHSVHHLSDPQAAASCALFSASQHAPGACAASPDAGAPTWTAQPAPAVNAELVRPLPAFRSRESRAPPALSSV